MQGMGLFFLLILLLVFRGFTRTAGKGQTGAAGKNGQKSATAGARKPAAGPGAGARMKKGNSGPASARVPENRGSLDGGTPEGTDPCHDDPRAVPTGSLGGGSPEGTDPCHDDPYAVPTGSLDGESAEGRDPCHDGWKPAERPEAPGTDTGEPGGLQLGWTGNDIVKGFVYGEILRRKAG